MILFRYVYFLFVFVVLNVYTLFHHRLQKLRFNVSATLVMIQ